MVLRSAARAVFRGGLALTAGGAAVCTAAYYTDPSVRRAVDFWVPIAPIVGHYYVVSKLSTADKATRAQRLAELHEVYAPQALGVALRLRGLLIKFGQQLSSRPEIAPRAYVEALRTLQSEAPNEPSAKAIAVVEAELGQPLGDLFSRFDDEPCGAASIAQAHRACTPDGREVVVKIQFPDAPARFQADLRSLRFLAWLYDPETLPAFDAFARQYTEELDFRREREHLREIRAAIMPRYGRAVEVPEVDEQRCSSRVLTMSFIPGEPLEKAMREGMRTAGFEAGLGDLRTWLEGDAQGRGRSGTRGDAGRAGSHGPASSLRASLAAVMGIDTLLWAYDALLRACAVGADLRARACAVLAAFSLVGDETRARMWARAADARRAVAIGRASALMSVLFDVYGFEIFELGLFNADPHPGNVLVMPDGRLGLIDYGQCKRLKPELQEAMARVIVAVADRAPDPVVAEMLRQAGVRTERDNDRFIALLARVMLARVDPRMMSGKSRREMFRADRLAHFPPDLMPLWRAAAILRGSALLLRCNLSPAEKWRSHATARLRLAAVRGAGAGL